MTLPICYLFIYFFFQDVTTILKCVEKHLVKVRASMIFEETLQFKMKHTQIMIHLALRRGPALKG